MAKQASNKGETTTFRKVSNDVRQQRLRRRVGDVKRLEVVLVADSERDQYIAQWMNENLGRGEASEFTRCALEEKVAREITGESEAAQQLNALFQMLAERDRMIERLFEKLDRMERQLADLQSRPITVAQTIMPPPTLPEEAPKVVQSSGLDMSRPRPRPKLKPGKVVEAAPDADDLPDNWRELFAKQMADSVKHANIGGSRS